MERMLDVSALQRNIDWKRAAAGGFSGVMVKASQGRSEYTEGLRNFEDSCFRSNVRGAISAGMRVGAYHYLTARTVREAEEEAAFFVSVLEKEKKNLTLWAAVDAESRFLPAERTLLTEIVRVFCEAVRRKGYLPMVYTNPDFLKNRLGALPDLPLWLANWLSGSARGQAPADGEAAAMRARYPAAVIWQWGLYGGGAVPGISGTVDGDILLTAFPETGKDSETGKSGAAGKTSVSGKQKEEPKKLRAGCTVRVSETVTVNGRRCARCYGSGYFRVWYDTYTLTSLSGDRAVIARDGVTAAAVPASILTVV